MNLRVSLWLVAALRCCPLGGATGVHAPTPESPNPESHSLVFRPLEVPYRQFTLSNGLTVILHRDTSVPIVARERLVSRRVGQRAARPHRLRASLRAPDVRRLEQRARRASSTRCSRAPAATTTAPPTNDRTNYIIDVPPNALELALFLESDRMGYLLDTMSPARVNGQRDVVKNERRQSYENRPYGMASARARRDAVAGRPSLQLADDRLDGGPHGRQPRGRGRSSSGPTTCPTTRAWSSPATSTSIARRQLVEKWFGEHSARRRRDPGGASGRGLTSVTRKTLTDRVQLPRLYLAWLTPRLFAPGRRRPRRGRVGAGRRQELAALQAPGLRHADRTGRDGVIRRRSLGSSFQIVATARPGHTAAEMQKVIDEEIEQAAARSRPTRASCSAR